jgi:transitional endoplasmic reticulum ATPase
MEIKSTKLPKKIRESLLIYGKRVMHLIPRHEYNYKYFLGLMNDNEKRRMVHSLLIPYSRELDDEYSTKTRFRSDLNVINNPDELDPSFLAEDLENFGRNVPNGKRLIIKYLESNLLKNVGSKDEIIISGSKFQNIINLLKLNSEEIEYLKFAYFLSIYPHFENFLNYSDSDIESLQLRASLLSLPISKVRNLIDENNRLEGFGLLEGIAGRYRCSEKLTSSFQSYLEGEGYNGFAEKYIKIDKLKSFDLESFPKNSADQEIILELLNSKEPCKILFYGKPGTGKTEYARSLLRSQLKDFILVEADREDSRRSERKISLLMADKMATETGRPILVDEAEVILNTQKDIPSFFFFGADREEKDNPNKQWVNEFLEFSKSKVIFIVNSTGGIHESTRRRFDYSIYFPGFTQQERLHHWNQALLSSKLDQYISQHNRKILAKEFDLSAGGISSAIATTEKVYSRKKKLNEEEILATIRNSLEKHQILVTKKSKNKVTKTVSQFNPKILNTDTNRDAFEKSVHQYYESIDLDNKSIEGSICALFHGKPGTGKTEYAKFLSEKLDRDIIVKSASSFMDMYVGNTEKMIREAFAEAERSKAILFIDEADTLLGSRENAVRSWEISHTNELLTCMENHKILFVASTNLLDSFDSAAMRRFHWKIKFSPLLPEAKWDLFQEYFAKMLPDDSIQKNSNSLKKVKNRVMDIPELCPGDFRAVYNRLQFDMDQVDPIKIVEYLENEVSYKKGVHLTKIGFS